MDSVLYKNFDKAIADAMETGDDVVSIECPCCHKYFYTIKSKAVHENVVRSSDDYDIDMYKFSFEKLGEKCPHCGYAGMLGGSDLLMKFGRQGDEARRLCDLDYEGKSSFADICRGNFDFKEDISDD